MGSADFHERTEEFLPEPDIPLAGFPLCKGDGNACVQEVQDRQTLCPSCGGPPLSAEIIRRTYLRQLRTAVTGVLACPDCKDKDPYGKRCLNCAFFSGCAYALGGIMERHGWKDLSNPLMEMIFERRHPKTEGPMDFKNMGDWFAKFVRGELAPGEFSKMVLAYLDSPDWRRRKAAQAAEDLKNWRAGRARLLDLVEKARADGYIVETEVRPLNEGHDSLVVKIEGGGTGFPSFMPAQLVEEAFADIMSRAAEHKAKRLGAAPVNLSPEEPL